jgi:hypothetical protein
VAIPVALQLNASPQQMQNMRGVGWLPALDTTSLSQSPPTSSGAACLRRLRERGITPQSQTDRWTAYAACEGFQLYDALLRATSGDSDATAVLAAVPGVMSSYVAAATVEGRIGARGGRIAPTTGRLFAYDTKQQFHYVSGRFEL